MKLNENYLLRSVAGSDVVVAVGEEAAKLRGIITLNETAVFIWRSIEKGLNEQEILRSLKEEYAGAQEDALEADLNAFLDKLRARGILLEG